MTEVIYGARPHVQSQQRRLPGPQKLQHLRRNPTRVAGMHSNLFVQGEASARKSSEHAKLIFTKHTSVSVIKALVYSLHRRLFGVSGSAEQASLSSILQ